MRVKDALSYTLGNLPILNSSFPYMYVGPYKRAQLYAYNPNLRTAGYFLILDADGDGAWEVGETAIFKAFYGEGASEEFIRNVILLSLIYGSKRERDAFTDLVFQALYKTLSNNSR